MIFTNNLKKFIKSLHQIKYRQKYNKFIAEGPKLASEFLDAGCFDVCHIVVVEEWAMQNQNLLSRYKSNCYQIKEKELASISSLKRPNKILMVFEKPSRSEIDRDLNWSLYLDKVQDPGNMGTILRIADWYGIKQVIASSDSVDFYNPKVVQSAMGAHNRIKMLVEDNLELEDWNSMAMTLDGKEIKEAQVNPNGNLLILGNESRGVRYEVLEKSNQKITIRKRHHGAESLNVSVACGIACELLIN